MAKQRRIKGAILEIELGDGLFAFGQDVDSDILFFDYFSKIPLSDVTVLCDKKALFFLGVYNDVITSGRWKRIGKLPIKQEYQASPFKFIQDSLNLEHFELYNPNTGEITKATKEQCEGLECAAVWEAEHVEDRLRDYFYGRPNKWVKQLAIK
jgi:hypothetical protein